MERTCRRRLRRLRNPKGGSTLKVLVIAMALMMLIAFIYQVFVIYGIANNISNAVERAVITLASYNKPIIYSSMREGNTMVPDKGNLFGREEIILSLCGELGAEQLSENSLERSSDSGGFFYRIKDLSVEMQNIDSRSADLTVTFITDFELEIPISAFWGVFSINIPMQVKSVFASKA